jgi:sugar phosphate isomerase/epimerase
MQRILSTYRYVNQKLAASDLAAIAQAGFKAVEVYCRAGHFNYRNPQAIRELADALGEYGLALHSLHAPAERDGSASRDGGIPISISDTERIRRLDAVEEIKRALEVAETIPCRFLVQHLGYGRQSADQRKYDAAFTSLEHLVVFAKARGVTIALENTPDELGAPSSLQHFIADTHLHDLKLCFDIGHAHMEDGVESSFDAMRDRIVTTHIHDNHGEKDEHLVPYGGTIDWKAALGEISQVKEPLPLVFELKDQGAAGPSLDETGKVCDKVEDALGK